MTATQAQTRRDYLKRIGVASGTVVTLGAGGSQVAPRYSPVGRAQAIAPVIPIGVLGGAAAVKYLTGKSVGEHAIDLFTGDDRDLSGFTGGDALHQEIATSATEMQSADERVMTSIENNIQNSENVAFAKGKAAIIEEMNAENPESDANTAMEAAIDDYYATIQTNLLNHWGAQIDQSMHMMSSVGSHSDLSLSNVFRSQTESGSTENVDSVQSMTSYDLQLFNGDEMTVNALQIKRSGSTSRELTPPTTETQKVALGVTNPSDDGVIYHFERSRYVDAWDEISAARDQVYSDLSGFVSDVYSEYEPGEIPTEDLVDPITAATELSQDYDNASGQSAHAAMLGIPTTAELSADLEIQSDEAEDGVWEVEADIFTDHVPREDATGAASIDSSGVLTLTTEPTDGATYTVETTDSETVDVAAGDLSSDGDSWTVDLSGDLSTADTSVDRVRGEEIGFETGKTYQPSDWSDPFYIAYNYVDAGTGEERGDFTQIESEFTIVEVTNSDGESVESFRPESRNNQTSDVSAIKDELDQLREAQIAMQEEAQEQDDGGPIFGGIDVGGSLGFLTDTIAGIPVWGWGAGGAIGLSVLGGGD